MKTKVAVVALFLLGVLLTVLLSGCSSKAKPLEEAESLISKIGREYDTQDMEDKFLHWLQFRDEARENGAESIILSENYDHTLFGRKYGIIVAQYFSISRCEGNLYIIEGSPIVYTWPEYGLVYKPNLTIWFADEDGVFLGYFDAYKQKAGVNFNAIQSYKGDLEILYAGEAWRCQVLK